MLLTFQWLWSLAEGHAVDYLVVAQAPELPASWWIESLEPGMSPHRKKEAGRIWHPVKHTYCDQLQIMVTQILWQIIDTELLKARLRAKCVSGLGA